MYKERYSHSCQVLWNLKMIPMLDYKTIHNRVLRRLDSIKKNKITEEDELFQEDILELERILKRMELRLSKRSYDKNNKII